MDEDELLRLFNEKSAPLSSPVHVGPVYGTQEGLQHSHVEGLPKLIVEVDRYRWIRGSSGYFGPSGPPTGISKLMGFYTIGLPKMGRSCLSTPFGIE